jgi:hypothetical protein
MKKRLLVMSSLLVAGLIFTTTNSYSQTLVDISKLTTDDANGEPDSMDRYHKIKGVVHGINMSSSRLDFTLIDGTGGIKIFDFDMFGYTPEEGDELEIPGRVGFYRGLTELVELDTVIVLSKGKNLRRPRVTDTLGAAEESELVTIKAVWFVTAPATWKSGNVDVTNGKDTFGLRVDSDTDVDGEPAPQGLFDVTGIGGQFDFSSPYTSGYQLFPQKIGDIDSTPYMPRPQYPIGTINTVDADGRADSAGVVCRLEGVVYGINYRPGGLTFTLIDATGGIGVFESSKDLGYTVKEGDSLMVQGEVGFYNGLTQMVSLDSIVVRSEGNMLRNARVVTMLDESAESNLVTIEKLWVIDGETKWPANGNIKLSNGSDTFTIRIDRDVTDLSDSTMRYDTMNVTGLGGQFDFSAPYDGGYQLFPRGADDIAEWKAPVSVVNLATVRSKAYPNPSTGIINLEVDALINAYQVLDLQGRVVEVSQLSQQVGSVKVDLLNMKSGLYTIILFTDKGIVRHKVSLN